MKPRNIKRWECKSCGYRSDRSKNQVIGSFGFHVCFRCKSLDIKETPEYKEWRDKELEKELNTCK